MSEPWFNPGTFGMWVGVLVGGVGGSLLGMLGAASGFFLPRGKGRVTISSLFFLGALAGVCSLAFGILALALRQPYGIWYPLLLCGLIMAPLCAMQIVVVQRVSAQVERRKMEARDLRDL